MTESLATHEPLLVNTLGHVAGALIFGSFLFLFWRSRHGVRQPGFWLTAGAGALALLWNAGSLVVLALSNRGTPPPVVIVASSFSVLSLLPAVLLHLSLGRRFKPVWLSGYALSAVAVVLHFAEYAAAPADYHELGLVLITGGFGLLTVLAVIGISSHEAGNRGLRSRIFAAMSLFLFAMSFVHFGAGHAEHAWAHELAFHHAGIPLALFILLQDYRFLLLDVFVRFLANALLAAAFVFAVITLDVRFQLWAASAANPFYEALLITALCVLLVGFAFARGRFEKWLTRIAFLRLDVESVLQTIRALAAKTSRERDFLLEVSQEIARFMHASEFRLAGEDDILKATELSLPFLAGDHSSLHSSPQTNWTEAVMPLRFSAGDTQYLLLGRRRGGRRYLSEDLANLAKIATVVVEQVERLRQNEIQRLVSQAEFRALQAQINPHFLFNSLNALYGLIPREFSGARHTVLNLAEIFRYFFQVDRQFIPLRDELRIVRAYLEIEGLRLGDRLQAEIDVEDAALSCEIPVLSVQPLVENAVKHGVSPQAEGGRIRVRARLEGEDLCVEVFDSGGGFASGQEADGGRGVGLDNVRRRLKLICGPAADLVIRSGAEGTTVGFRIPAARQGAGAAAETAFSQKSQ